MLRIKIVLFLDLRVLSSVSLDDIQSRNVLC